MSAVSHVTTQGNFSVCSKLSPQPMIETGLCAIVSDCIISASQLLDKFLLEFLMIGHWCKREQTFNCHRVSTRPHTTSNVLTQIRPQ